MVCHQTLALHVVDSLRGKIRRDNLMSSSGMVPLLFNIAGAVSRFRMQCCADDLVRA